MIPKDGPSGDEVRNGAEVQLTDPSHVSYALVKITPTVARHVQREMEKPVLFRADARSAGLPSARVGAGDTVTVTIFEAQAGGLFIPGQPGTSAGNFVTIPAQQVDRSGQITVPYAGAVAAVGRTPSEIQAEIESKLRSRAIEPQVVVNISNRQADEISVLGEVNAPARFSLEPGGTKILNAIARAGGTRNPGYEPVISPPTPRSRRPGAAHVHHRQSELQHQSHARRRRLCVPRAALLHGLRRDPRARRRRRLAEPALHLRSRKPDPCGSSRQGRRPRRSAGGHALRLPLPERAEEPLETNGRRRGPLPGRDRPDRLHSGFRADPKGSSSPIRSICGTRT